MTDSTPIRVLGTFLSFFLSKVTSITISIVMLRARSAADFLYRLRYLVNQPIENLQTDNRSEFAWEFERATAKLGIQRYFSRVKTPKDNPEIERFNETLEYEWLYNFNITSTARTNLLPILLL
jgi:transposase InsO family protein